MDDFPVAVSFIEDVVQVQEGEAVQIGLVYNIAELADPFVLELSPLEGTAKEDDYDLGVTSVAIPAGVRTWGTRTVTFAALADLTIAEGDEMLELRLVQPEGIRVGLGQSLELTIADAGAHPLPGVVALASPVASAVDPESIETTLHLRWGEQSDAASFDWVGPVRDPTAICDNRDCFDFEWPVLALSPRAWRVEIARNETRHSVELEWARDERLRLRFRADSDSIDERMLVCGEDGCEIVR